MADTIPSQDPLRLAEALERMRPEFCGNRATLLEAAALIREQHAALAAPQPNAALADEWVPIKELGYDDDGEALLFKHAVGVVAAVWLNEDHPDAEGRGWHEAWSHKRLWDYTHMHALPAPPTLNASEKDAK